MHAQTKSTDKCICPHCGVIFYISDVISTVKTCYACKKKIRINLSIEYTCTAITESTTVDTESAGTVNNTEYNRQDSLREAYLNGHRDAQRRTYSHYFDH